MRRLRERVTIIRKARPQRYGNAAQPQVQRTVWAELESAATGFMVVIRAEAAADILLAAESDEIRGEQWRIRIDGVTYKIDDWSIVDSEKPRQYIGLKIHSLNVSGSTAPFS